MRRFAACFALAGLLLACNGRTPEAVQLPEDVPQYPGSVQTVFADAWRSGMGEVDLGTIGSYETGDKPGKVLAFYRRELEARGWRIEDGSFIDELARVRYAKELRNVTIWVFRDNPDDPTHLFVSATQPEANTTPAG
jgi:hypothetical protein